MKIDTLLQPGQMTNISNISDVLRRLNIGDVIRAQVLEAGTNELILKLFDGTVLAASTLTDTGASKGEFIDLMINNKNDKQVFLEIVRNNKANPDKLENEIVRQLMTLDINPDESNFEIARLLKSNNLPLDRQIFNKIADFTLKYKTDLQKVLFLITNNMEPVEKNIASLIQLVEGSLKIGAELDKIIKVLKDTSNNEVKTSFTFLNDLENLFLKVAPEELKSGLDVKNLYKDILVKLQIVKDELSTVNTPISKEILDRVDNLENSIRFLDDLNNHNAYIQVPLNLNDKNTTGELYVLKRGPKRKRIDPENTSLLISLNTQNLGLVESLINISKKNISINIRVENQTIIDFIKENYRYLYASLFEKGYKLVDARYSLIQKETNILNAEENLKKEFGENRRSVDYRI